MRSLVRMLALGGLAWVLRGAWPSPAVPADADPLVAQALAAGWVHTDPLIRARLVENLRFVGVEGEEEALFTHALALGMERTDPVVRRRLQSRALAVLDARLAPSETELRAFFAQHSERYQPPLRIVADHRHDGAPGTLPAVLTGSVQRWERRLGEAFSAGLVAAPLGEWVTLTSRLGTHEVRVRQREQPPLPDFETLRARVEADWRSAHRGAHRARELARLEGA